MTLALQAGVEYANVFVIVPLHLLCESLGQLHRIQFSSKRLHCLHPLLIGELTLQQNMLRCVIDLLTVPALRSPCRLILQWLYTLTECIWLESQVRVARDKTGRVRLCTLLLRALNFGTRHEATARRDTRPL